MPAMIRPKVLHLIERLTLGGAGRALIHLAGFSTHAGRATHRVVSLAPAHPAAAQLAASAGLALAAGSALTDEVADADIVHIHFWNTPELYALLEQPLGAARIAVTCHVGGLTAPQVLTREVVEYADVLLVTSPLTLASADDVLRYKAVLAPSPADFGRLGNLAPVAHAGFRIGYVGAVDFAKMHPHYAAMHAAIDIPEAKVIVCGQGTASASLKRQMADLGAANRFELCGHVEDIAPVLASLDVFGYPLCADNYATSELALQEAMFAGLPCVVFAQGGPAHVISDGRTGFVVDSEAQYIERIAYLHKHPEERARIGAAAAAQARQRLGIANLAPLVDAAYEQLLRRDKQARQALPRLHGADALLRSLGNLQDIFRTSLLAEDDAAMAADTLIAQATPVLASADAGGVLHYRRFFPDDAMLRLWSGLILLAQQRPALAAAEFTAAHKLGVRGTRAETYLARAIRTAHGRHGV